MLRQRLVVYFAGQVQGVGFRYTARQIASEFDVTGFVKNLDDGRVYLVAEGEPGESDRFLETLTAEMSRFIRSQQVHHTSATGEFADFSIRR